MTDSPSNINLFPQERVLRAMTEVLTVYTSLNGVPYVQGMNEILAIIFYVMKDESDSFWAFNTIMNQLGDLFTAEADTTQAGIYSQIDALSGSLRCYNYELWKHLCAIDFPLTTLAMRWITTLLAMDLTLPDTIRVWDILLQSSHKNQLLGFSVIVSLAYLMSLSGELMNFTDGQEAVEFASRFGRGVDVDTNQIIVTGLSIYAFESILRSRYFPATNEPVLDVFLDVVGVAKDRVVEKLGTADINKAKEKMITQMVNLGEAMSGWIGKVVATIPSQTPDGSYEGTQVDGSANISQSEKI